MRYNTILLIVLLVAMAQFSFSATITKDLKMELKEKRIRDFNLDGLTLVFYVNIVNSSSKAYFLSGYDYRFIVDQRDYLGLQMGGEEKENLRWLLQEIFRYFGDQSPSLFSFGSIPSPSEVQNWTSW